jgi:hypothetical protein
MGGEETPIERVATELYAHCKRKKVYGQMNILCKCSHQVITEEDGQEDCGKKALCKP